MSKFRFCTICGAITEWKPKKIGVGRMIWRCGQCMREKFYGSQKEYKEIFSFKKEDVPGICEQCGNYYEKLSYDNGLYLCENCLKK